jgi:CO/xanthine dehydrogenase Mo-binding subunit
MTTRRTFLKTSGMLVVGIGAASAAGLRVLEAGQAAPAGAGPYPDPDFRQLDSWIVIRQDGTATFYVGKTDLGQGTATAFRQIMSDELDLAYDDTSVVMGSTDVTVDPIWGGGAGPTRCRPTGGPCAAWRRKRGASSSRWRRRDWACPSARSW